MSDYFRVDNPKHTHKRSTCPVWRQKISVSLNNGSGLLTPATEVGVVTPWLPPTAESLAADLTPEQVAAIKSAIAGGLDREGLPSGEVGGQGCSPCSRIECRRQGRQGEGQDDTGRANKRGPPQERNQKRQQKPAT